jgi:hypothetical protein
MLGIIVFYLWKAPSSRFTYFLEVMMNDKSLLTAAISFSLLMNAIVFTWCVNTRKDKTARGIFLVTLVITIPALIYKFFFR